MVLVLRLLVSGLGLGLARAETPAPAASSCGDLPWHKTGDTGKDCEWVKKKPTPRCVAKDEDGGYAFEKCFGACGGCDSGTCYESRTWRRAGGDPTKGCSWVRRQMTRCATKGDDGSYAYEKCRESCHSCDVAETTNGETWLAVQSGVDGTLALDSALAAGANVTLSFCGTETITFSDRPFRQSVKTTNDAFADGFDDAFRTSLPNAALVSEARDESIVLELLEASFSGACTTTYRARVIAIYGNVDTNARLGAVSLFVDPLVTKSTEAPTPAPTLTTSNSPGRILADATMDSLLATLRSVAQRIPGTG